MGIRVQVVVTLVYRTGLLALDEPTSGLDPLACGELLNKLSEFMTDERHSILPSTYITTDLDRIADLVAIPDVGRMTVAGARDNPLKTQTMVCDDAADLTGELRARIHGLRQHSAGQEGPITAVDLGLCGTDVMADTPPVEDLLMRPTKERKGV